MTSSTVFGRAAQKDHVLAHGLGNSHYIDPQVYERENNSVISNSWASVGFAKDVPNPGDVMPTTLAGQPLLIVRDDDGAVQVFENVCRHRGMILVEEPGHFKKTISCRYHAWCYGFKGNLKATPHIGGPGVHDIPEVNKENLGLIPVRATVWMDVVYVNLSGAAAKFEAAIQPLTERWSEFMGQDIFHGGADSSFKIEVNCNWKLAIENYCESYHLPWVHPALNKYSRLQDHYEILDANGGFSGQGTTVYDPKLDDSGRKFAYFKGLSSKWDTGAEYVSLFPNTLLGIHKDHYFAIRIEPLGPHRTREHVEIYYTDPEMTSDRWADLRAINSEMWKTVFTEDVFAVEGMQKGRSAPGFDGGAFSPVMDKPTQMFHEWVRLQYVPA